MTGLIADNVAYFARALRGAGLKVGQGSVLDAVMALESGALGGREDVYWTMHAVFVKRREDMGLFNQAFALFWRRRALIEKMMAMMSPEAIAPPKPDAKPKAAALRVQEAFTPPKQKDEEVIRELTEFSGRLTISDTETLKGRDFAQMSADEVTRATHLIAQLRLPHDTVPTRRFRPDPRGSRIDLRRTLRQSMRAGGAGIQLAFREQAEKHPPVVALVDISGSMAEYSRILLHFLHALTDHRRQVHSFTFGTRLTNVSRMLRTRDPDEALALCGKAAPDWEGGTRIGQALHDFNRLWSRRVLTGGAVVLLFTDGLERQGLDQLGFEADRLHRSSRRLVWLNPLLRFDQFEARAGGIRALLPHVDEFRTIHNLASMEALVKALGGGGRVVDPRVWLKAG
ncbi:MAG: VWA domain-containing protein [Hyphomicrobiales bacterium]|nr:VWA domain-containing protein [Hyphomicrobiales bacterium]